ncbi:MAG: hypothetical protein DELT_01549 [Desulfovibrio sp.]
MTVYLTPSAQKRVRILIRPLLCILLAALVSGCASRTSTESIRESVGTGNVERLEEDLRATHESYGEMVTALNLARAYQLGGRWAESIKAFEEATVQLEEYENRAVVNIREMLSGMGTIFFSRGAENYFGAGYERSLLHTFNALNYLMLGDFSGAAVEMRRMDQRQALWLEESQARIEKFLADHKSLDSPDSLPASYSMRGLLSDPEVRRLINNYQEPFSYALAAILYRLAGDFQAADVSMRRAMLLDQNAQSLFTGAWPPKSKDATEPHIPRLPLYEIEEPAEHQKNKHAQKPDDHQEVTVIAFAGLAPALHVENVRIWFPAIGYILVDLPSYKRAVSGVNPAAFYANGEVATLYPLLRTDILAYRTLWDEIRMEYTFAMTRAATRAGVSTAAYIAASSHEDTQAFASLIASVTTLVMDLFASSMAGSVRNWETLPNVGYIAMTTVPRGTSVTVGVGNDSHSIDLPGDARGVIILANELSNNNVKVSHVTY